MSDDAEPTPKKKKGKKGRKLMLLLLAVLLLGGGGAAGLYFSGMLGSSSANAEIDPNQPQLVPRDGATGDEAGYESAYFPLEKEFTSNLRDSIHFVQIGLAVSTNYDDRVIANVEKHQVAIRSAVLMTLSETEEELVFSSDGKKELQKRLVASINETLEEKSGFGGVGNVYFTNFIVQ